MAGNNMAVDDLYQKLRLSFPFVHVRYEDVQSTPELARILLSLTKHVDETGTSRSVAAELQSEQTKLAEQLQGYHATLLLHSLLEDMAVRPAGVVDHSDSELRTAVQEGLSLAELRDSLPLASPAADGAAGEHTLLELTTDDLALSAQQRQTLARLPRALDQQLARLGQKFVAVVCPEMDDSEDLPSLVAELPSRLEDLLRARVEAERRLHELLERRDAQILKQSQLMGEQLTMLLQLITKHKLDHKVEVERKTIDYLTSNIQGMLLKIRLLTLQIQCETYTESCLSALRAAARHVRSENSRLDARLSAAKQQLATYQSAGQEFSALAQRYRQLCQELDHQRWLISEMDTLSAGAGDAAAPGGH